MSIQEITPPVIRPRSTDSLGDLLDPDRGTINACIFVDSGSYKLELERIFARTWLLLCPDMSEDRVIVPRQRDGSTMASQRVPAWRRRLMANADLHVLSHCANLAQWERVAECNSVTTNFLNGPKR
jgi:hypothetical protein